MPSAFGPWFLLIVTFELRPRLHSAVFKIVMDMKRITSSVKCTR